MTTMPETYRVAFVGGDRPMRGSGPFKRPQDSERAWRLRVAEEQQALCNRLADQGYRLDRVVPADSSGELRGGWTEGLWLYFVLADGDG